MLPGYSCDTTIQVYGKIKIINGKGTKKFRYSWHLKLGQPSCKQILRRNFFKVLKTLSSFAWNNKSS